MSRLLINAATLRRFQDKELKRADTFRGRAPVSSARIRLIADTSLLLLSLLLLTTSALTIGLITRAATAAETGHGSSRRFHQSGLLAGPRGRHREAARVWPCGRDQIPDRRQGLD